MWLCRFLAGDVGSWRIPFYRLLDGTDLSGTASVVRDDDEDQEVSQPRVSEPNNKTPHHPRSAFAQVWKVFAKGRVQADGKRMRALLLSLQRCATDPVILCP